MGGLRRVGGSGATHTRCVDQRRACLSSKREASGPVPGLFGKNHTVSVFVEHRVMSHRHFSLRQLTVVAAREFSQLTVVSLESPVAPMSYRCNYAQALCCGNPLAGSVLPGCRPYWTQVSKPGEVRRFAESLNGCHHCLHIPLTGIIAHWTVFCHFPILWRRGS